MNILVINNDLTERSVIQQVLEHNNHIVTFVKDVNEAQHANAESVFRFIIVDPNGQEQSIQDFIKNVRSIQKPAGHTYILLLVEKDHSGKLVTDLGINADDYLNKPVVPQELKARVAVGVRILSMGDTLSQAHKQLDNLAMYDYLTGLLNRQAFYKVAQGELERARRASDGVSVIALDVDNFKSINREYGHSVGDDVLKVLAQIIREKSRPYDCIGRWSGDQFTLALPSVMSTDAEKVVRRIFTGVKSSEISLANGTALEVRLTAGIASAQNINAYTEIDSFIQSAVQALNNSKQNEDDEICVVFV